MFDWTTWRAGSPLTVFGIACRSADLLAQRDLLRRYAVGWCLSERLACRPKRKHIAVLFHKDGVDFWFHMRLAEAIEVFKGTEGIQSWNM